jgi:hypothetical protein
MIREKVFDALEHMFKECFSGIPPDEMETARKVLKKILAQTNKGNF